jgi:hypothetical protein
MVYVGPDEPRVRALVQCYDAEKNTHQMAPLAQASIALGCESLLPKHFKIIKRLSE